MSGYSIQQANFKKQKNELKDFASQAATNTRLDKFDTGAGWSDFLSGGLLGLFSGHKVTGEELNKFVSKLQNCFIEINERERRVIKEFGQVYETFEALDKGYIQGILISVKSAEEACKQAQDAQKDIDDTINTLQLTITKLKEFKDEVSAYKHLPDIDEFWNEFHVTKHFKDIDKLWDRTICLEANLGTVKNLRKQTEFLFEQIKQIASFSESLKKYKHIRDIDKIWEAVKEQRKSVGEFTARFEKLSEQFINEINDFSIVKNAIVSIVHLKDIDEIWQDIQKIKEHESTLTGKVNSAERSVSELSETIAQQNHINDIDSIWEQVQKSQKELQEQHSVIDELHKLQANTEEGAQRLEETISRLQEMSHINDIDEMWELSQGLKTSLDEASVSHKNEITKFNTKISEFEKKNTDLTRKVKIAYFIAASGVGLSILPLILHFIGVLW